MPFDLENKITWKELAPSLQSLFKTLQQQITKNANDIENLMGRMDEAEDRLDEHDTQIAYLYSISQKFEIVGEKNGYPIGINTINLEDGTQLISQYWVERHFTSGGGNPETGFVITFPRPMDRVLTVQVEDTYYSTAARGLGWVDGEWWIRSSTMNGAGFQINYDSVHETDDNHTFQFYCMCTGYVLTGEAPEPPDIGPGEGGGGDTGGSLDDRFNGIQDQIDKLLNDIPIGTVRYAYIVPTDWIELNGQILNRSDYTDLYEWAKDSSLIISDSEWNNNNQGKFSYGNESSTFRVPDLRGKFIRSLDSGAGIDNNRVLGTYQMDSQLKTGSTIDNLVNTLNQTVAIRGNNQVNGDSNWVSSLPTFAASWEYFKKNEGNRHAYYRNAFAQIPGTRSLSNDIDTQAENGRTNTDGSEVRPLNIALKAIMKAK